MEAPRSEGSGDLHREIADLRASRERLVLSGDDERRAIERSLHDGLQQRLVGIAANLELVAMSVDADPAEAAALLSAMRQDLREALEESRALAEWIFPALLEQGGLNAALRGAATRENVAVAIEIAREQALTPATAGAIYFSCADALASAGAGASATIRVRTFEGATSFEVLVDRDLVDGRLLLARDRVEALGGSLDVNRTRLVGSLPHPR